MNHLPQPWRIICHWTLEPGGLGLRDPAGPSVASEAACCRGQGTSGGLQASRWDMSQPAVLHRTVTRGSSPWKFLPSQLRSSISAEGEVPEPRTETLATGWPSPSDGNDASGGPLTKAPCHPGGAGCLRSSAALPGTATAPWTPAECCGKAEKAGTGGLCGVQGGHATWSAWEGKLGPAPLSLPAPPAFPVGFSYLAGKGLPFCL